MTLEVTISNKRVTRVQFSASDPDQTLGIDIWLDGESLHYGPNNGDTVAEVASHLSQVVQTRIQLLFNLPVPVIAMNVLRLEPDAVINV